MTFRRSRRTDDWPTVHDRARAALSSQLDGELEAGEGTWLDTHLAGCPDCRRTADEYAAQRFELRRLRERQPLPPRDLWARTAAAIEAEAAGRSGARRSSRRPFILTPTFIATALAVVVATGVLTSSQLFGPRGDGSGSTPPQVAVASDASSEGGGSESPRATPLAVTAKVDYVGRDSLGQYRVTTTRVDEVCPSGSTKTCDASPPVQEHSVTIDANAQAVFGDGEDGKRLIVVTSPSTKSDGSVAVVTLAPDAGGPSPTPSASPAPSTSPTSTPMPSNASASPSGAPSVTPTPTPTVAASVTPTPTVTASPTGSIDVTGGSGEPREIAHGVALVGQTAAYSRDGTWFAFTARPIDGSAGPDIYLWRVGSDAARRVTDGGRTVFGSWTGDTVVASRAIDARSSGGSAAPVGLAAQSFLLDPSTAATTALPQTGSAWRPVVDPSGRKAVYWTGTLRAVPELGFAPGAGRLVLGDWGVTGPAASGSPEATPLSGDQASARHETTIGAGQIDDWDARWDPSGTHLAVWIADHQNPAIGRLSLYAVSSFDGSIDLKSPLLPPRRAAAGFSITDGSLIWAEPAEDSAASDGSIQLLVWNDQGVGAVETLSGPALVIR